MTTLAKEASYNIEVDSAATHDWNIGSPPDSQAYLTCKNHGIDISNQKARQICREDFKNFDVIFVMDQENYKNIHDIANHSAHMQKVSYLSSYIYSKEIENIPDPYNKSDAFFNDIYDLIYEACTNILNDMPYDLGKTIIH